MLIRIAARQSDLARLQAFEVGRALENAAKQLKIPVEIEFYFRASLGDQRGDDPLWKMPEKGVFTEDFVADLAAGTVDLVVHSWKDLPIGERSGSKIVATLVRADARDVLLVRRDRWSKIWAERNHPSTTPFRILTSSPRRIYNLEPFLKWALPWGAQPSPAIEFVPVRGNIATRVKKLVDVAFDDSCDGLVVAKAALDRLLTSAKYGAPFDKSESDLRQALKFTDFVVLPLLVNPAAAAQGALAIEVRTDRKDLIKLCEVIDSPEDRECVEAERRELARHGGGCHQKIGVTILSRPYGQVKFIKGLTDANVTLNSNTLKAQSQATNSWPKPERPEEVYFGQMKIVQRVTFDLTLPTGDYFVARANAWPSKSLASSYVWTAGLDTWRKLAEMGVWVHGSSEGLGELENARIDVLAGRQVKWTRLTHEDAGDSIFEKTLATYKVEIEAPSVEKLLGGKYFFWKSGSQFNAALSVCPAIANGYHGSGPGQTQRAIQLGLARAGLSKAEISQRVSVFLKEDDFRNAIE